MWCHLPRQRLSRFACIACSVAQSCPTFCNPYGTVACQAPLSMGFSRQDYWSGLPFPHPGYLPNPRLDGAQVSCIGRWILYRWTTWEAYTCLQSITKDSEVLCVCVCVFWSGWGHKRSCMNKKLMQPAMLWVMKSFNCNLGVSGLLPDPWTVADFYMHRISRLFVTLCTEVYSGKCGSSWAKLTTQIQCRGPGREKREESRKRGTKLVHDTSRIKLCQYTLYYSFKWNFTR